MGAFVLLTPGFPEDEQDTTCLPAFQQFALSVRKNYPDLDFTIITFQYPFRPKHYLWHGIQCIAIGGSNKAGFRRFITWIKVYFTLRSLNKRKKIKGILSLWLTECSLIGKFFCQLNTCRHYTWLIGQDAKLSNQYIRRIKPKGSEIIAMSDFLQETYLKNHGELPFMVVENGINPVNFPTLNTGAREIDVLGVGSLIPLKNYSLFIEIIAEVIKAHPTLNVCIAGIGEEEHKLKDKVTGLGLQNTIRFLGLVPHQQVFDLMNHSKIFLHTSEYEGNSTVLMEALYNGCHTISTQPLADKPVKNLFVTQSRPEMIQYVLQLLNHKEAIYERICFNTMDESAKKIINLYYNS